MRILSRWARAAGDAAPDPAAAGPRDSGAVAPVGAVNGFAVLETVATLPISTWRYVWEPEDVRHLGPMAQDWHAAFGFTRDDTRIPVVDGLGVALVCIQALQRHVEELRSEVARLREAVATTPSEAGR
ncbi:tail fiber domain-containing protein [Streptomyces sp. NPDC057193]|uniref:tail fiber domain-containing protein n=1 Tax=Streptomyces sp. NPDC057193 TaxID=3346043 RepID=UPI00364258D9